jgi:hypothetical protein
MFRVLPTAASLCLVQTLREPLRSEPLRTHTLTELINGWSAEVAVFTGS